MSNVKYSTVLCDKCQTEYPLVEAGTRATRATAKKAGWKLGKTRDLCPECSAELDKAVKTLLES